MPVKSTPNPTRIWPMLRLPGALKKTKRIAPINAKIGARVVGLSSCKKTFSPPRSERRMIWPVTVVPILAPMMTPIACGSCMMPEFTRPMTITVVAAEDWIKPVSTAPEITAITVVEVSFLRMPSILPPASFSRPEPMILMPYKNSAMPPASEITEKIFIVSPVFR